MSTNIATSLIGVGTDKPQDDNPTRSSPTVLLDAIADQTQPDSGWLAMKLFDAPLGTRFRYIGRNHVYVLLDRAECGLIADAVEPSADRRFQGAYSVADSHEKFRELIVEVELKRQGPLTQDEAAALFKTWRNGPLWLHMVRETERAHHIQPRT